MNPALSESISDLRETIDLIAKAGAGSARLCYQCALCDSACPWNRVKTFLVRRQVREARFGLARIESDDTWQCASCGLCAMRCPRGVGIVDIMVAIRRIATQYGVVPEGIRLAAVSLMGEGNPWGGRRTDRADWAKHLEQRTAPSEAEVLYFPCCAQCYEQRTQQTARATVEVLDKAGVPFVIAGSEMSCCGESIRKAGDEEVYARLARDNIKAFIDKGVKKILVSSPHCYQSFKNDYAEYGVDLDVVHTSQYLWELLCDGRLELKREYAERVVYHDPCYLGRHNRVFEEPREILRRVPGLELLEMSEARDQSLCCGGGGGRIWTETPKEERLSDLRLAQAVETGASVLATFCPYCVLNFEGSRISEPDVPEIVVKDVTEIVRDAI